jgi:hypothetical protein
LAITGAELVTALVNPTGGVVFHTFILFALLLHAALVSPRPSSKLYLALSLVPLIRILSLSLPLADVPQIYWYLIIATPLLIATFIVILMLGYRPRDVGLTLNKLPLQLLIAMTGIAFGFIEYQILKPEPLIGALTLQGIMRPAIIMLIATGFAEELMYRGVMQRSSLEAMGTWGLLYITAIFAVLHIGYLSAVDVLFVFAIGLFFALMVKKTGSLLGVSLSHGITNIFLFLIIPFL